MASDGIAAIILGAGLSRRMGANKLIMRRDGQSMIAHTVHHVSEAGLSDIVVVTGSDRSEVERSLRGLPVRFVHCSRFRAGMGASLSTGINALEDDVSGVLICLGDMPEITAGEISEVREAFLQSLCRAIVVPTFKGRRGHPVAFPRSVFPALAELRGDEGARGVLKANEGDVVEVGVGSDVILRDIDDPDTARALGFGVD